MCQSFGAIQLFETGSLIGLELTKQMGLAGEPQGYACLCLP